MEDRIAIFGYSTLILDAGPDLQPLIIERIPHPSPRPVEFSRLSRHRGNAPALAFSETGGVVNGQIMVLDLPDTDEKRDKVAHSLWLREGRPPWAAIRQTEMAGFKTVFYIDIEPNIPNPSPRLLADFAINSVAKCAELGQAKNGIRYLRDCIKAGIETPLTQAYMEAILAKLNAKDLEEAERIALSRIAKKA